MPGTLEGQGDVLIARGQSPSIRPSGPVMLITLKSAITTMERRRIGVMLRVSDMRIFYNFFAFKRSELPTTETLENAIANPANAGESIQPRKG